MSTNTPTTQPALTPAQLTSLLNLQIENAKAFASNRINHTLEGHPSEPFIAELNVKFEADCGDQKALQDLENPPIVKTKVFINIIYAYEPRMLSGEVQPVVIGAGTKNVEFLTRQPIMLPESWPEGELMISTWPEEEGGLWWEAQEGSGASGSSEGTTEQEAGEEKPALAAADKQ